MNPLTLCAFALAAAGTAFGLWQWAARRRTLRKLNQMLDRAIAGGFVEDTFNETELSALESRLARFLQGSASARKTIEGEQAAVKTLIADISHQTRTPIANLLLYASLLSESELSPRQQELARSLMVQGEKLSFLIQALVKDVYKRQRNDTVYPEYQGQSRGHGQLSAQQPVIGYRHSEQIFHGVTGMLPVNHPSSSHHERNRQENLRISPDHTGKQTDKIVIRVPYLRIDNELASILHHRAESQRHDSYQQNLAPAQMCIRDSSYNVSDNRSYK